MTASDIPLNFDLIGNPVNWLIIVVVLVFVAYATFTLWQISPLSVE